MNCKKFMSVCERDTYVIVFDQCLLVDLTFSEPRNVLSPEVFFFF